MLSNSTINGLRKDLYNVKNENKQLTNDMLLMRIDVVSRLGEIYKNLAKDRKNKEQLKELNETIQFIMDMSHQ